MTGRIEITSGDTGWRIAEPLLSAVWPPEVVARLPWRDVVWAHADHRVLVLDGNDRIVCHVGLFLRMAKWNGRPARIGGVGGVATREESRRQGLASLAMRRAADEFSKVHSVDFALLFCEPHHAPVYQKLGWHAFAGDVFVAQPAGRVRFAVTDPYVLDLRMSPHSGQIDLCGLPW
jgi:aminoglycoside 2'-N-acetyltransferase I